MTDKPREREVDQDIEELAGRLGRLSLTPTPPPSRMRCSRRSRRRRRWCWW